MLQDYARVSTADQNPDAQRDALIRAGVHADQLYVDYTSGAKSSRPQWDALYKALRDGDILVATRLDRVGRSTTHLVSLLDELGSRRVAFRFLEQGIDTTTSEGRLMYRMLAAIAEFQRDLITANTREGLAAARARGRIGGRKPRLTAQQIQLAQQLYDAGEKTVAQIAAIFKVPRTTVYGHLDNNSVGTRPRAQKPRADPSSTPSTSKNPRTATSPAPVTEIPRPGRARLIPSPQERSPQERDRLIRQRRRRSGPAISTLACPSCEPTTRPQALQQREDLTIMRLDQPEAGGPIIQHSHCVHCPPHLPAALLACARCGDGPLLTGVLAEQVEARDNQRLPTALHRWLADHGWQITPELLCPHDI